MNLVRILPRSEVGRDILGNPNEEGDQEKGNIEGHWTGDSAYRKVHFYPPEQKKNCSNQKPADIVYIVVGEKININERAQKNAPDIVRVMYQF